MQERYFAIAVVLFALVVFSSFVGSISAKITEIRQLRSRQNVEVGRVREYLRRKNVSLETGIGISSFLRWKQKAGREPLRESDLPILAGTPVSLLSRLRMEIHSPALISHPMFEWVASESAKTIVALCNSAMTEVYCKPAEEVFGEDESAKAMYFVVSGKLRYRTPLYQRSRLVLGSGLRACVSEACLWGEWLHCGQLVATSQCSLTALNPVMFRKIVKAGLAKGRLASAVQRYCAAFANLLAEGYARVQMGEEPMLTDIIGDTRAFQELLTAFRRRRRSVIMDKVDSFASVASVKSLRPMSWCLRWGNRSM